MSAAPSYPPLAARSQVSLTDCNVSHTVSSSPGVGRQQPLHSCLPCCGRQLQTGSRHPASARRCRRTPIPAVQGLRGWPAASIGYPPFIHNTMDEPPSGQAVWQPTTASFARGLAVPTLCCLPRSWIRRRKAATTEGPRDASISAWVEYPKRRWVRPFGVEFAQGLAFDGSTEMPDKTRSTTCSMNSSVAVRRSMKTRCTSAPAMDGWACRLRRIGNSTALRSLSYMRTQR